MSTYINFYLQLRDKLIPLRSVSRNSEMYDAVCAYVPYGKSAVLTSEMFTEITAELQEKKAEVRSYIKDCNELIEKVTTFNNSVEEKMAVIDELKTDLRAEEETLEEIYFTEDTLYLFKGIVEQCESEHKWGTNDEFLKNARILMSHECAIEEILQNLVQA